MWFQHASLPTSSMMSMHQLPRGNTLYHASVRILRAGARVDTILTTRRIVVKEVEATSLPVARTGTTVSGMIHTVNFVKTSIPLVAVTPCHATRGTTVVAGFGVASSVTRRLMARPPTMNNINHCVEFASS